MKRCLVPLLVMAIALAFAVGCSSLQVKSEYAPTVVQDAARADAIVAASNTGTLTPAAARAYLAVPTDPAVRTGTVLVEYYTLASVNWFQYAFDSTKKVYADAALFLDLKNCSLDAAEAAKRATSCSDQDALDRALREAKNVRNVDHARRGVSP